MGHGYHQGYARMQQGLVDLPEDGASQVNLSEAVKPVAITSCRGPQGAAAMARSSRYLDSDEGSSEAVSTT